MKPFYKKNIQLGYFVLILLISCLFTFYVTKENFISNNELITKNDENESSLEKNIGSGCEYKVSRLGGYQYIKPLLYVDNVEQSEALSPLKQNLNTLIDQLRKDGTINLASVYLKDYSNNGWISINEKETYSPGSLLKVPELITYLRMNEDNPGLLDKKLTFSHTYTMDKSPKYVSKSIELGKQYTIRELLNYMIAYSDNNATMLLNDNIDVAVFKRVFTDIGLKAPNWNGNDYPITVFDFNYFMRELYNASYLNITDSEYAIELLSRSDFNDGIVKGIPENTKIAHKFGEAGNDKVKELHESAIVYLGNKTYLLTIMTKGENPQKLPEVISKISSIVYQNMAQ